MPRCNDCDLVSDKPCDSCIASEARTAEILGRRQLAANIVHLVNVMICDARDGKYPVDQSGEAGVDQMVKYKRFCKMLKRLTESARQATLVDDQTLTGLEEKQHDQTEAPDGQA